MFQYYVTGPSRIRVEKLDGEVKYTCIIPNI